jgi:hypothetical protein
MGLREKKMMHDPSSVVFESEDVAEKLAALWDWMERFRVRYTEDHQTVVGAMSFQLNLYIRDSLTEPVVARVANAARGYVERFGEHLNSVYAIREGTDEYHLMPFSDVRDVDPYDLLTRYETERFVAFSDSDSVDRGGQFEFTYYSAEEEIAAGCGILQVSIPPRAIGGPDEPLSVYWQKICEIVQPVHGSGGYGLTVALSNFDKHQHAKNDGVYRRHVEAWPCVEANAREVFAGPEFQGFPPHFGLREHIRTTGWITVLGDHMLEKLDGKDAVANAAAEDPFVQATGYEGGLILQTGGWPVLGDAKSGPIPSGYGHVARLTKDVRHPMTQPDMLGTWGWNTYEEREEAWKQWRERFDEL